MKRMAALLGVMGLMAATVPATSGAKLVKKPAKCGGEHYLTLPLTQTKIPFPYC
jgi:hypothetical protein